MPVHKMPSLMIFLTFLAIVFSSSLRANAIQTDRDLGSYPTYDATAERINIETHFFYYCKYADPSKCKIAYTWNISERGCAKLARGTTFEGYSFIFGSIKLTNDVSVDPTTVPKSECHKVKKVIQNVSFSVKDISCERAYLNVQSSLDSTNAVVIEKTSEPSKFQTRCEAKCSGDVRPSNKDLCTWCGRVDRGEALFPNTIASMPEVEDLCGSHAL